MKKAEADKPRTMERRQFLGVSAAVGASAALGGSVTPGHAAAALERAPRAGYAACEVHQRNIRWAIPAKHLNTLWTLLWPRLAARVWKGDVSWPAEASPANPLDIRTWLQTEIDWFLPHVDPNTGNTTAPVGSDQFQNAIGALRPYLTNAACPPIRLLGAGGYDFYVTEDSIDLWAPPRPDYCMATERQLMAAYEYRRTGRPAIAIGGVQVTAGVLPEAPTGPGQIEVVTPEDLLELCMVQADAFSFCGTVAGMNYVLNQSILAINQDPGILLDERARIQRTVDSMLASDPTERRNQEIVLSDVNAMDRADRDYFSRLKDVLPRLTPHPRRARIEQIRHDYNTRRMNAASATAALVAVFGPPELGEPEGLRIFRRTLSLATLPAFGLGMEGVALYFNEPMCPPLTTDLYWCKIQKERCWAVSGTVYRGILEQFPRFVAERWGDDLDRRATDSTIAAVDVRQPAKPSLQDDIKSRMETELPARMRFEFMSTVPAGGSAQTAGGDTLNIIPAAETAWDPRQLMITNSGFFFPSVIGNGGVVPDAAELLEEIIHGRAGNPVFTDSSYCE